MRISDWSSDVCSSDLFARCTRRSAKTAQRLFSSLGEMTRINLLLRRLTGSRVCRSDGDILSVVRTRSEEHTSELQSLMRISYAVFCLKKKNKQLTTTLKATTHNMTI